MENMERGEARVTRAPRMLSAREFADEMRGSYRPMRRVSFTPGEEEFEDVDLQESEVQQSAIRQAAQRAAQSAKTAAQNARQTATQFTRRVAARLNAGYRPVPTSEIEAEQDIEMGDIGTAEQDVRSAQAAEGSAEDAFEDISRGGVPELVVDSAAEEAGTELTEISAQDAANALSSEALADSGEVLGDSLGVDAAADGALETSLAAGEDAVTDTAVEGVTTGLTDAGIDAAAIGGAEAATDAGAAGSGALVGAFNPGTDVADAFTFGLASLVGAGIGAGVGAGVGAAVSAANKPKPGLKQLSNSDVNSALSKLQKKPTQNASVINMIKNAQQTSRPIFQVTTDTKNSKGDYDTLIQAQLSSQTLSKAVAAIQANGNAYKGQSKYVLQAMGLNQNLANGVANNESPSQITRQHHGGLPDVTPPTVASITAAGRALQTTAEKTAAQTTVAKEESAIATISDPQAKAFLQAKLKYFKWQHGLISGPAPPIPSVPNTPSSVAALAKYKRVKQSLATTQQRLQSAQTSADQTSQQAKARYASYISGVNKQQQQAGTQYNQHLYTTLQQYAPQYDAAVAQQNLQTAMQATKPTQLLQFNVHQSYNAHKQTYAPLSTQLPGGQSSGNSSQNATRSPVAATTPSR